MSNQLSTKLAAIVVALAMNSLIIGSMALLFDDSARPGSTASAAISRHDAVWPA
ncbi:MAG TPA: hypothetical protein VHV81_14710 [Steroidobacteraceae bacterium]|jgi:hypothetical protein|nr:hypothetical protein [Steroidobacteraceae bacterium]